MKQRFFAGTGLLIGVIAALTLSVSALSAPVPGAPPTGSPLADIERVRLDPDYHAKPVAGPSTLLVFHDSPREYLDSVDERALFTLNLLGHFGPVTLRDAGEVSYSDVDNHDAVVYVRDDTQNEAPGVITDLAVEGTKPLLWAGPGLDAVLQSDPKIEARYGFRITTNWTTDADGVVYNDTRLERSIDSHGFEQIELVGDAATPLGLAYAGSDDRGPFAVKSGNLIHVVEVPVNNITENSHWQVYADLLFELLDPARPARSQAMLRLEDVGPYAKPELLIEIADGLHERNVPFSVSVYALWVDRNAKYGMGTEIRLADRPEVVDALKYMQGKGGTIIFHGLSHQNSQRPNPYSGTSGDDYEFFAAEIDSEDNVIATGPLPEDSPEWVLGRVRQALAELDEVGLGRPTLFEFPHYQGSRTAYRAIAPYFDARYERGAYFQGELTDSVDESDPWNQIFPYPVLDVYGEKVLPENMGNIIPVGYNNNSARSIGDILESAAITQSVIRDSYASMYYHPYLGPERLFELVEGIQGLGYRYVSPQQVLEDWK